MSDYQPTETDMRVAMLNRGFTDAQVSALLRSVYAQVWEQGYRAGYDHADPLSDTDFAPTNPYRGGQ